MAAAVGAFVIRDSRIRPLTIGLLLGVLGFIVPPTWLFNINTSRWLYRAQLNVFGTILAVCALDRWTSSQDRVPLRTAIVVAQLCWIVVTVAPVWYSIVRVAVGLQPPHRR